MSLDDARLDALRDHISNSFRVHPTQDPTYVDVSGHLNRLASPQHQVIFGRRGTGKSCLLVHYHRRFAPGNGVASIYLNADDVKQLSFPDVLIRTLIVLFEGLPGYRPSLIARIFGRSSSLQKQVAELRHRLDQPNAAKIERDEKRGVKDKVTAGASIGKAKFGGESTDEASLRTKSSFAEEKIDYLQRHLPDFKALVIEAVERSGYERAAFLLDDLYLIKRPDQPDFVDYLHRLLRGTNCYLKLGTVRHRTSLMRNGLEQQ